MMITRTHQRGATLIEVMVAMIVLAIGILGIAALQTTSVQANYSSYYRSQATLLAADITDRMRANRTVAIAGSYAIASFPASSSTRAVNGSQAEKDKAEWLNLLGSTLPEGTGTIVSDGNNVFTVTIQWNDARGRIKQKNQDAEDDVANPEAAVQAFTYRARL